MRECTLCPRLCHADRLTRSGFCGGGITPRLARAALHFGEEPCIGGRGGAGAVFFSGCTLRCCFCQNEEISRGNFGADVTPQRLADIFLRLQEEGAKTLDLVTPTQDTVSILKALELTHGRLLIPVVWNSGGYERVETLRMLEGYVSVYLPDLKFCDPALSAKCAAAPDYFETALAAIREMHRQTGAARLKNGVLQKGVLVRHLVLPAHRKDSIALLRKLAKAVPPFDIFLSIMRQYTPCGVPVLPELSRRVTGFEYDSVCAVAGELGFGEVYIQDKASADMAYLPNFSLRGV